MRILQAALRRMGGTRRRRVAAVCAVAAVTSPLLLLLPALEGLKHAIWARWALAVPHRGKLMDLRLPAPSMGAGQTRECWLYVPPGAREHPERRYPVVVLLHGAPGAPIDFLVKGGVASTVDRLTSAGRIPECLLALPDGRGAGPYGASMYVDAPGQGGAVESWIAHDLPADLLAHWQASPDPRAWTIGGLSDGAFGAANMLCRHPDRFRSAFMLSGFYRPQAEPGNARLLIGLDPARLAGYTPIDRIASLLPAARYYVHLAVGRTDHYDRGDTRRMAQALEAAGLPHDMTVSEGGHDWSFWSEQIARSLVKVSQHWPSPAEMKEGVGK